MEEKTALTDRYPFVVATKYRLQTQIMKNEKQVWDINCKARIQLLGEKRQSSAWVAEMNSFDNNIHFVINEEATIEQNEDNIKNLAAYNERKKVSKITSNDVLERLAAGLENLAPKESKPKKEKKEKEEVSEVLIELRKQYSVAADGKKPFHGWDEVQLQDKINELNAE